jgi:UDP-N-acetylmuramoylalanine--D-glutamate ligase
VHRALCSTPAPPHRVEFVAEVDGVRWVDDSKSTAPHATLAAVAGFEAVVLVAGGRNKGLDLSALAAAGPRVRAVVGIGESAQDVVAAFPDRPSAVASSMAEAVGQARSLARPGDTVLLSPACASFDWYGSYAERGRDFAALVLDLDRAAPT